MVSAQDSGPNGPGSSPGRGNALCSWERHFNGDYNVTAEFTFGTAWPFI